MSKSNTSITKKIMCVLKIYTTKYFVLDDFKYQQDHTALNETFNYFSSNAKDHSL